MKKKIIFLLLLLLFSLPLYAQEDSSKEEYSYFHIVDINHPTPLEDIQKRYFATNNQNLNLTGQIQFETNYSELNCIVGRYALFITVEKEQEITKQTDYILVVDFESPFIELNQTEFEFDAASLTKKEEILSHLYFKDNYDVEPSEIVLEGLEDLEKEGDYCISIYAYDSSRNPSNKLTILLHLYQTQYNILLEKELVLKETTLSKEDILEILYQQYSIPTDYESIQLDSTYFFQQKPGIYLLTLTCIKEQKTYTYHCKLTIEENPKENKPKRDTLLYVSLAVLGIGIGVAIIIYKKRS